MVNQTTTPAPTPTTGPPACGTSYCIIDLGGSYPVFATAVNDQGAIVGGAGGHAFLWRAGLMNDVGTLPPAPNEDASTSVAYAVNALAEVVGASGGFGLGPMDGLRFSGAFVFRKSMDYMVPPSSENFAFEGQQAFGVSDSGTIVGIDQFRGFVFGLSGKPYAIPVPPLSTLAEGNGTVATAVNKSNEVAGATTVGDEPSVPAIVHAFLWKEPDSGTLLDLGTTGGFRDSIALAINDAGTVVGFTSRGTGGDSYNGRWIGNRDPDTLAFDQLPQNGRAFVWQHGVMRDLGTLSGTSAALAINDGGTIVGTSGDRAVAWFDARIVDLGALLPPQSGWHLQAASGINNRGWIVGWGAKLGERHAFLLRPK